MPGWRPLLVYCRSQRLRWPLGRAAGRAVPDEVSAEISVEADFSVELGRDDPALEIPWAAENGPRYLDLKRNPELLSELEDAQRFPELQGFLRFLNSPSSILESAKCDAWASDKIHPEEEIFGAACKFGSYVDLLFSARQARIS